MDTGAIERLGERMRRSGAQEATITKQLADRDEPLATEHSAQIAEPTAEYSAEIPSRSDATDATASEIDEVLQARRARQFAWERAIDVDRSGDVNEQAQEAAAIEHLAEYLRGEGASEATITQEIAKQTAGREADLERNTQAQAEHERHIDKLLEQQRKRLLAAEQNQINHQRDTATEPQDHTAPAQDADRNPYVEQAIQREQERQQAWEQEIEQDRENDRGYAA